MLAFAILNLIAEPGRVSQGTVKFEGENLLDLPERKIRDIRGNRISMIFQDPMVTLNPVLSIGTQMMETLRAHRKISDKGRPRTLHRQAQGGRDPLRRVAARCLPA